MSDLHVSHLRDWIFSSPPAEWAFRQLRELLIGALKQGPIPQHVAFVMDGNRRYAQNHKIEKLEGHHLGFEALARVLEICYKCGVKVVTVYAFSIENFKRPKYEVDGLMSMAKTKLSQLMQHGEVLDRYGAGIRVLGQRDLIPPDVLKFVDKAVTATSHNDKAILNICFPYTAREEITQAVRSTVQEYATSTSPQSSPFSQARISQKIRSKNSSSKSEPLSSIPETSSGSDTTPKEEEIEGSVSSSATLHSDAQSAKAPRSQPNVTIFPDTEGITPETLSDHMYTSGNPPLDMFVRTSGVERLSDFMLWQCHQNTQIFFLKCMWPDFGLWHFLPVLVEWQWRQKQKERDIKPQQSVKQKQR